MQDYDHKLENPSQLILCFRTAQTGAAGWLLLLLLHLWPLFRLHFRRISAWCNSLSTRSSVISDKQWSVSVAATYPHWFESRWENTGTRVNIILHFCSSTAKNIHKHQVDAIYNMWYAMWQNKRHQLYKKNPIQNQDLAKILRSHFYVACAFKCCVVWVWRRAWRAWPACEMSGRNGARRGILNNRPFLSSFYLETLPCARISGKLHRLPPRPGVRHTAPGGKPHTRWCV